MFDSWWECPVGDDAWDPMDSWYVGDDMDDMDDMDDTIYPRI